jgi:hypothetical protein
MATNSYLRRLPRCEHRTFATNGHAYPTPRVTRLTASAMAR